MGWNSWNKFGCNVSETLIKATADAMVSSGMRAAGYQYVNIDDCWMSHDRNAAGQLVPDPVKFPDGMKALADYVHGKKLKLGIYSSAGTQTCAGYPASLDHETTDAQSFADWGIDYLKYDNCNNENRPAIERYTAMANALKATGRPIVLSICEWGQNKPWEWGASVGGQLWRTTGDITDSFSSVLGILDQQVGLEKFSGPGAWNDPDMLEVGNGGMTDAEYRAHFSLWALLNAPLLSGNDLRTMSDATKKILMNKDVVAVDQDWGGQQGALVSGNGTTQVWAKPMSDGSVTVALLNRGPVSAMAATTTAAIGLPDTDSYRVKDLWTGKESQTDAMIRAELGVHGVSLLRIWPKSGRTLAPLTTLSVGVDEVVEKDQPFTTLGTVYNDGSTPLIRPSLTLVAPAGWKVQGSATVRTDVVQPHRGWTATWKLVPDGTGGASLDVRVDSRYFTIGGGQQSSEHVTALVAVPPPAGSVQASSLPFISTGNGWGPVERNTSNGENQPGDGLPMSIAGVKYATGIGAHAPSTVRIYLGGKCTSFSAMVGVDDETHGNGSVAFTVVGDNKSLAQSPVQRGNQAAVSLTANVTGVHIIDLQVSDGGDGNTWDHADWAVATLTCS
ncbi:NPCBM/NEW2 domain-containing protein [Fodinicola feengrottensis]|uniref:Alpha-galactosidase n=3 Tax=Fodinicola feengrottensis TaxID=435914 RepID=A0ABP4RNY5_9ACTN